MFIKTRQGRPTRKGKAVDEETLDAIVILFFNLQNVSICFFFLIINYDICTYISVYA